jgi:hypothetical protein
MALRNAWYASDVDIPVGMAPALREQEHVLVAGTSTSTVLEV